MQNMMNMMKQAQEMQKKMKALEKEMEEAIFQGQAGGGLVTVTITGKNECKDVKIQPDAVDPEDIETLEDLVRVAMNDAQNKISSAMNDKMGAVTGGMKIPGLM